MSQQGRGGLTVLGMHRSGTSATSQIAAALGLSTVPATSLIKADEGNRHGYFEPERLVRVNDAILERAGGTWDAPPSHRALRRSRHWDIPRRSSLELRKLLPDSQWFWKDPRLALTLHLWEPWLHDLRACVVCIRHPHAVADSLAVRDGFAVPQSIALWERYTSGALRQARGRPTFVMIYEHLIESPSNTIQSFAEFLVSVDVLGGDRADSLTTAADVIKPESARSSPASSDIDNPRSAAAAIAEYERLISHAGAHTSFSVANSRESSGSRAVLDQLHKESLRSTPLVARLRARIPPTVHVCVDQIHRRSPAAAERAVAERSDRQPG